MSKIDWRSMFKGVLSRMRDAGESNEMGARWMATEADAAVYELTAERDRLREALSELERYVSMECYDQWLPEGHAKTSVLTMLLDRVRVALSKGGAS
jgi:hypothetical protein